MVEDRIIPTNYKHQITNKLQISNRINRQLFGILNFGHCDLPFDLAQGGGEPVEPFAIYVLLFEIFITETQNSER
jgi:hypothetical protein